MTAPPSIPVPSCVLAFIVLMLPPKLTCTCPSPFSGILRYTVPVAPRASDISPVPSDCSQTKR